MFLEKDKKDGKFLCGECGHKEDQREFFNMDCKGCGRVYEENKQAETVTLNAISYIMSYGTMFYHYCTKLQNDQANPGEIGDDYLQEKLNSFIRMIKTIGLDNFEKHLKLIDFEKLKDSHHFNTSIPGIPN